MDRGYIEENGRKTLVFIPDSRIDSIEPRFRYVPLCGNRHTVAVIEDGTPIGWALTETLWKAVPSTIGIMRGGAFHRNAPVKGVVIHPPGACKFIRPELYTIEIQTEHGSRRYGAMQAFISSGLRVVFRISPGCERDEVLAKWPAPDAAEMAEIRAVERADT